MLSAAHVLAMDAKNLLDVVDSVRIRYPDLFMAEELQTSSLPPLGALSAASSAISSDPVYGKTYLSSEINCFIFVKTKIYFIFFFINSGDPTKTASIKSI